MTKEVNQITINIFNNSNIYNNHYQTHHYDSDCDSDDDISINDEEDYEYEYEEEEDEDEDEDVEIFKRIDGCPNYSISNHGNVWSDFTTKILKHGINDEGYHLVGLRKNGKGATRRVHRLVGLAFIQNPNDKPIVDHIDGDPSNNHVKNLRWASFEESAWNTKSSNPFGKGVYKHTNIDERCVQLIRSPYYSKIRHQGNNYDLGIFKTLEEASIAYEAKAKELFGVFYRKSK